MRGKLAAAAVVAVFAVMMRGDALAGQPGQGRPPVDIQDAWARQAAAMGNGAMYVSLRNQGAIPDALVSAATDVAVRAELHETTAMGGTIMMRPLAKIDIPAGARLEMKP